MGKFLISFKWPQPLPMEFCKNIFFLHYVLLHFCRFQQKQNYLHKGYDITEVNVMSWCLIPSPWKLYEGIHGDQITSCDQNCGLQFNKKKHKTYNPNFESRFCGIFIPVISNSICCKTSPINNCDDQYQY